MFSETQVNFLTEIVSQYDYYVCYYYASYYDYTAFNQTRDTLIQVYCSDILPTVENGVYSFSDCTYYAVTFNKYVEMQQGITTTFSPLGSTDIVYTNVSDGCPQLCYLSSEFQRIDWGYYLSALILVVVCLAVLFKTLFGGRS